MIYQIVVLRAVSHRFVVKNTHTRIVLFSKTSSLKTTTSKLLIDIQSSFSTEKPFTAAAERIDAASGKSLILNYFQETSPGCNIRLVRKSENSSEKPKPDRRKSQTLLRNIRSKISALDRKCDSPA